MITDNELNISNQSYTHKDFYQIYPEILDLVKKITNKWDPQTSNESDPGVVLLKLLAFVADKLNYNIDKNILECFMPSCTQEESMRKLCDMMGYSMHYYRSAVTKVTLAWTGNQLPKNMDDTSGGVQGAKIIIPKFTSITDEEGSINYITLKEVDLRYVNSKSMVDVMQGELVDVQINEDNIVRAANIDSRNRYYLPETKIAENGIFIQDSSQFNRDEYWERIDNLNTIAAGQKYYKVGFDSSENLPYIQFPEDYHALIGEGFKISYIRTNGADGNVAANTLTKLSGNDKVIYVLADGSESELAVKDEASGSTNLLMSNYEFTSSGEDLETIDAAYENFKKTVGTFDTLVTCRDYANAIYRMVESEYDTTPLVSNVQVADIRDDINKSNKIVSMNASGLTYIDVPKTSWVETDSIPFKVVKSDNTYTSGGIAVGQGSFDGSEYSGAKLYKAEPEIGHFDIMLYPLHYSKLADIASYDAAFKPAYENIYQIKEQLSENKTIAHKIRMLSDNGEDQSQIFCLKNYYPINCKIATTHKVNKVEEWDIINRVELALCNKFQARKVDFGEDISYDQLVKVIESADPRIKMVVLDEPEVYTKYMLADGTEGYLGMINNDPSAAGEDQFSTNSKIYMQLAAKNALAGKTELFNYDERFNYNYGQSGDITISGGQHQYLTQADVDSQIAPSTNHSVTYISTEAKINLNGSLYQVRDNESLQLVAPNLTTKLSYPTYVYYYFVKADKQDGMSPCKLGMELNASGNLVWTSEASEKSICKDGNTPKVATAADRGLVEDALAAKKAVYRRSLNMSAKNAPGYLVDEAHYKVQQVYEFTAGYYYFAIDENEKVTLLGSEPTSAYIPANSLYQLKAGDELYIHYTDSEDNPHFIKYYCDGDGQHKAEIGKSTDDSVKNIISPTFDMYDSAYSNESLKKTLAKQLTDLPAEWQQMAASGTNSIKGLFTLGSNEQIDMKDYVELSFKSSFKYYWILKNKNNVLRLHKVSEATPYDYEYILDADEYFFYTDDAETSLNTMGSGTRIVFHDTAASADAQGYITKTLVTNTGVALSEISEKGLGAFSDVEWNKVTFRESDYYLTLQEMRILTLREGNTLKIDGWSTEINNDWQVIPSTYLNAAEVNGTLKLDNLGPNYVWKIRSRLNLSMGPNYSQTFTNGANKSEHRISLLTSYWMKNNQIIDPSATPEDITNKNYTEVVYATPMFVFGPGTGDVEKTFRSNYVLEDQGGPNINAHIYLLNGQVQDDLYIYAFDYDTPESKGYDTSSASFGTSVSADEEKFNSINLDTNKAVEVSVPCPAGEFTLITLYYESPNKELPQYRASIEVKSVESGSDNCLSEYKSMIWNDSYKESGIDEVNKIQFANDGLYVIRVSAPCKLSIGINEDISAITDEQQKAKIKSGIIKYSKPDLIYFSTSATDAGLNYKLLGLAPNGESEVEIRATMDYFLKHYIVEAAGSENFYYNAITDNAHALDVKSLDDAYSWTNVNNVCSKFTIPVIDTSSFNTGIQIARSSKVDR